MIKINFKNNLIDFWGTTVFSIQKKIPVYDILKQAFEQGVLIDNEKKILTDFIDYIYNLEKKHSSQIFQDIFVSFVTQDKFDQTFLEFGATNGIELSNTFMLEKDLGWSGVLAEPDIQWHDALRKNRPNTKIITKCIWKNSNDKLNFFSSDNGVLSTLEDFKYSDKESMPVNSNQRNSSGKNIVVETISLNEVIQKYFDGICPSYISVDTEGSEFEILNSFDFSSYKPAVFTVEHNFTKLQKKIDELMIENNYVRIFKKLTSFDAWYISAKAYEKLSNEIN